MTVQAITTRTAAAALAAIAWIVIARHMTGMDMGVATEFGPLLPFLVLWVLMMAAMMLPGAIPAVVHHGRMWTAALFVAAYLTVWTLIGIVLYAVYQPHLTVTAGVVVLAAGVYELTPLKRDFRRRCRDHVGSGFAYGMCCAGSSLGLMLIPVAVGLMNLAWTVVITVVVTAQKLLPPRAAVDVPLGLLITALGVLIVGAPSAVPGLIPAMTHS